MKTELEKSLETKPCLNNKELQLYIDCINERNSSPPPSHNDEDMGSDISNNTIKSKNNDSVSSGDSVVSSRSEGLQGWQTKRIRRSRRRIIKKQEKEIVPSPPVIFDTPKDDEVQDTPPQNRKSNINDGVD